MRILLIALTLSLAACGVDGAPERPERPERERVQSGVSITGTASVGITGGS